MARTIILAPLGWSDRWVTLLFTLTLRAGVVSVFLFAVALIPPAFAGVITRVSVSSNGTEGNSGSDAISVSADGRFVAFTSDATNLVAGDTNSVPDVFHRDTCLGAPGGCSPSTVRASVASDGAQGNSASGFPAISANGRFVAFVSAATNLVPGDTNDMSDVFVRDTCVGAAGGCTPSTIRVSVASDGTQGNSASDFSAISANGRFVAFVSAATNLVPGDTNGLSDVFLRDTCLGAGGGCVPSTIRASLASDGTQLSDNGLWPEGDGPPSISSDGRFVAFSTFGCLYTGPDGYLQLFCFGTVHVRDTCSGAAGCLPSTVSVFEDITDGWPSAAISGDGRFVSFTSAASGLVADDTNNVSDVFLHDTCLGAGAGCVPTTVRVSVASDGTQGNDPSFGGSLSSDGRYVAFVSVSTSYPNSPSVFVRDTCWGVPAGCTPSTTQVSSGSNGVGFAWFSPALSADGTYVAFVSDSNNLVAGDTNGQRDAFLASISGTGAGNDPLVALSPGNLVFGSQPVGSTSAPLTVSLANTSTADLTISNIVANGDFAQTNNCGNTVAAGTNCTISVKFIPIATGSRSGTVAITDNAAGSPHVISLSGTGISNQPPVASFISACTGLMCSFDGSASSDPDGTIASYAWSFGDGTSGSGKTVNHTYAACGTYQVTLTVRDSGGATTATQPTNVTVSQCMHVGDLDPMSTKQGNTWTASVTVAVHNSTHNGVSQATVSGSWSTGGTGSCITSGNGKCTVSKSGISRNIGSVTFTVGNVTHATFSYKAGDNHEPDGDSNGTSIAMNRP
jgi:PKD repeat protein